MRTEESLREALEFFAERAGQLEPEPTRTPVRRVRRSVVLTAVAATVAAAVLVPVVLDRKGSPPPVTENTTTPKPPLRWTHQQLSVYPTGATTRTYSGPNQTSCHVSTQAGSYDLAKLGKLRKKTTVNGHPADLIQAAVEKPRMPVAESGTAEPKPTPAPQTHLRIAWSYRNGSWALADCSPDLEDLGGAEQRVQGFAESVDFGTPQLTAPIDFGYLPPGAQVQGISATAGSVQFGIPKGPTASILVSLNWPPLKHVYTGERAVQINGRAGRMRVDGTLLIPFGTFDLVVQASSSTGADQESMVLAIAKGIRVADPMDRSSWFPAEIGLSPR
ncbi:hypothetical protein [Kribbella catacumbae]|uniref:hypothetical protein n=1 Tax=Kribbella catacumbae TaxID=460086 RepID=UPI0003747E2D|nr:hypothetical protein [Kribbella catacumbae]